MSNNQQPSECHRCWEKEKINAVSRRQELSDQYGFDSVNDDLELLSIDINVTWACNLACVMCSPRWSSTWATELGTNKEQLANLGKLGNTKNSFVDRLDISKVQRLHFNGGEPLINHNHVNILEKFNQRGSLSTVAVSYNTNGTVYPSDDVVKLWSQTKFVKLLFSIDATGAAFEYIRYPATWLQVQQNIQRLRKEMPSNVMFGVNVTVGGYNLLELKNVSEWFDAEISTNREGDASDFSWNFAHEFGVDAVAQEVKSQVAHQLDGNTHFANLATYLTNSKPQRNDEWIVKFNSIDQRRGTNWRKDLAVAAYY